MTRILHIIPSMASSYGGPSYALAQMQSIFRELNVDSTIAATYDPNEGGLTEEPNNNLRLFSRQPPKTFFYSYPMMIWLKEHTQDYDIVHIHSLFSFPAMIAGHYARLHKKPYLVRPFGTLDRHCMKRHAFRKQFYFELFERNHVNQARVIHCTSESEKEEIARFKLKSECKVIPLGVMENSEKLSPVEITAPKQKKILFLSRIDPKKGLELLFIAIKQLKIRRQDFKLLVAGTGNETYVKKIKRLVSQYGITDVVVFLGEMRGKEKNELLHATDIFILPSRRENFGLAVVEAMQAGCPVVVSNQVAIHKDIADSDAGTVVMLNPASICSALEYLLNDKARCVRMGQNAKMLVMEKFDLRKNAQKLIFVYQQILSESRVPSC